MKWKEFARNEKLIWCIGAAVCIYAGMLLRLIAADFKMTAVSILGIVVIFVGISVGRFFIYRKRLEQLYSMIEKTEVLYGRHCR